MVEAVHHWHGGRFGGARRARNREELTARDRQRDAAKRVNDVVALPVVARHVADLDDDAGFCGLARARSKGSDAHWRISFRRRSSLAWVVSIHRKSASRWNRA